jgi:hypothetical protein
MCEPGSASSTPAADDGVAGRAIAEVKRHHVLVPRFYTTRAQSILSTDCLYSVQILGTQSILSAQPPAGTLSPAATKASEMRPALGVAARSSQSILSTKIPGYQSILNLYSVHLEPRGHKGLGDATRPWRARPVQLADREAVALHVVDHPRARRRRRGVHHATQDLPGGRQTKFYNKYNKFDDLPGGTNKPTSVLSLKENNITEERANVGLAQNHTPGESGPTGWGYGGSPNSRRQDYGSLVP